MFHEALLSFKSGRTEIDPSKHWYYEELAFFDQHVIPLAEKLKISGIFGIAGDECLCIALDNRSRWEAEGEQIVVERFSTFDHKSEECKGYE